MVHSRRKRGKGGHGQNHHHGGLVRPETPRVYLPLLDEDGKVVRDANGEELSFPKGMDVLHLEKNVAAHAEDVSYNLHAFLTGKTKIIWGDYSFSCDLEKKLVKVCFDGSLVQKIPLMNFFLRQEHDGIDSEFVVDDLAHDLLGIKPPSEDREHHFWFGFLG